jgi:Fe2+ transport system protein B
MVDGHLGEGVSTMSGGWDKWKDQALKILGKDAEVPDWPDVLEKAGDSMDKAREEFNKVREECESKILALQNSNDAVKNALKQFEAKIEKSDFNLKTDNNKENLKKVLQARKLLTDILTTSVKHWEADDKVLDELDKHVEQLGKYKPKDAPI